MNHDGRPHSADRDHHEDENPAPGGVVQSRTRRKSQASGLCQTLGSTLFFLDALGGAVFLPVLPTIIQEVLGEDVSNSAAYCSLATWVGLLAGAYYTGNLIAAQVLSLRACCASAGSLDGASSLHPLVGVGLVLGLSAGTYIACGLLVVRELSLWWFAALRLLSGMLAATYRVLGFEWLEILPVPRKQREGSIAALSGLVVGCAVSGEIFSPGSAKPILWLCLAAAGAHVPSFILLLFIWRRNSTSSRGAGVVDDWSALTNSDCESGHTHAGSAHPFVRRELGGGGEIEVELTRMQSAAAVADRRGCRGGSSNPQIDEKQRASLRPAQLASMVKVRGRGRRLTTAGDELAGGSRVDGGTADQAGIRIPNRYLRGCKGDPVEAERRWRLTLEWRAHERVDEVLREPQPHFDVIKRHYPHFIHRRARNGCPVWVELPGRINLPAIRSSGVSTEELRRHYVFVTEYLWGVVETDFDHGQALTVLDVQGLGMRDLAGEALGFVKQATAIVQDHYVERSNRMFIINAPSYFSMIWRVIRPMLNERTQAKIGIINTDKAKIAKALLECIPPENLPTQYGGTCPLELGDSEEERDLRAYVASITPNNCDQQQEEEKEVEVEVQLRNTFGNGSRSDGDREGGFSERKPEAVGRSPAGGPREPSRRSSGRSSADDDTDRAPPPGAARRVLDKVGGAIGRAGGVIFNWRRSPAPRVAHLGEENAFVYDTDLQRWVLKDEAGGGRGSGRRRRRDGSDVYGDGGSLGGPSGPRGEPSVARRGREDSTGSSTSEEMTVLAIQAAHYSQNEAAVNKVSLARSTVSPVRGGAAAGRDSGNHAHEHDAAQRLSNDSNASTFMVKTGGDGAREGELSRVDGNIEHEIEEIVVLSCSRCTRKPFGHHDNYRRHNRGLPSFLPSFASICYSLGVAIRESFPVWALAGSRVGGLSAALDGGLGATPPRVGFAMAAGVLVAAVGRAIASAGWCGSLFHCSRGGQSGWSKGGGGSQIINAMRGRLVTVTALGILYTIARVSDAPPATIGMAVVWLAVVAAVASNQIALEFCLNRNLRHGFMGNKVNGDVVGHERTFHEGSEAAGGEDSATLRWLMAENRGFLIGDVVGSVGGPLLLALGLRSGMPSPFDSSLWFLLCLCVDLCISVWARPAGDHTKLADREDEAEQDVFGGSEWGPRSERSPEFV